jgi:hypothetical protein
MANHLTPDEISELTGMRTNDVLRFCMEESVPVYQGRIDKTLFVHTMIATGRNVSDESIAAVAAP